MIQQAYKYVSSSLKSSGWGLGQSELLWEQKFFIATSVFPIKLLACQLSMIYAANWPRLIYLCT